LNTCTVLNQFGQCTGVGTTTGFGNTGCLSVVNGVCIGSSIGSTTATDVNFDFTVTLSPASTQTVQVDWTTADGSAVSGTDYQAGSGTLTFNPGDTTKTITVRAFSRNVNDISSRDFLVRLSNPRNASISDSEGRGRIERSGGSSCGSIVNGVCTNTGIGTSGCTSFINGVCVTSGFGTTSGVSFQTTNVTCGRNTTCSFTIQNFNTGVSTTAFWTVSGSGSAPATVGSSGCTSGVDVSPASGSTFVGANSSAVITLTTCNLGGGNVANEQFTVSLSSSSGFVSNSTAIGTFNQT